MTKQENLIKGVGTLELGLRNQRSEVKHFSVAVVLFGPVCVSSLRKKMLCPKKAKIVTINNKIHSLPTAIFHLKIRPFYLGLLKKT